MKKIIALFLTMMMVFAFAACGSSDNEEEVTEAQVVTEATETETEATEETSSTAATETSTTKADEVKVEAVSETVWAVSDVNVREGASTDAKRVATIKKGDKIKRTGILSNGWSRVNYNGKDMYVSSKYLTTKNPEKKTTEKKTEKTTQKPTNKSSKSPTKTKPTKTKESSTGETTTENTSETETEPTTETTTEATTTETTTEATTETTTEATTEPATDTDKGVVAECDKKKLTLDNENEYDISKADVEIDIDNAVGMEVVVEYYAGTDEAVHVYPRDGAKAVGGAASGSGMLKLFVILGLIAAAIAAAVVVARNRRGNES